AEGANEEELRQDTIFLKRLWTKISERMARQGSKKLLYGELALAQRVLRDFVGAPLDRILVDSRLNYERLIKFTKSFMPEFTDKIELYSGMQPIFDLYDVENEIHRAMERKVNLKSGGYLIIDQTEAMTT